MGPKVRAGNGNKNREVEPSFPLQLPRSGLAAQKKGVSVSFLGCKRVSAWWLTKEVATSKKRKENTPTPCNSPPFS